jgi:hypothetical protein
VEHPARGRYAAVTTAVLVLAWLCPASAVASTVSVTTNLLQSVYGDEVLYVAAPGERNEVSLRMQPDPSAAPFESSFVDLWTVSDPGAVIHPGESCTSVDPHTAECRPLRFPSPPGYIRNPLSSGHVLLGDRDDRLLGVTSTSSREGWVIAKGGAGDDRLSGGVADDDLRGDAGDDWISGAEGADQLVGGGGRDRLFGGASTDRLADGDRDGAAGRRHPGRDLLDGGTEPDLVSYRTRRQPVIVDLADPSRDGGHGEGDLLRGIEAVYGGHGDDQLAGDAEDNVLDGRGGHNQIAGRGGDDVLRSSGLPISCGAGRDIVSGDRPSGSFVRFPFKLEYLRRDCESIENYYEDVVLPARPAVVHRRSLAFRLRCPFGEDEPEECSATARLTEWAPPRRQLDTGSAPEGSELAWLRLTRLGRQLAARPNGVRVAVRLNVLVHDEGGSRNFVMRWGIRLTTPR